MSILKFNDGSEYNTAGELRTLCDSSGWYVIGGGFLIPCSDSTDANQTLKRMSKPEETESNEQTN